MPFIDAKDINRLSGELKDEKRKVDKVFGLSDEVCADLIKLYLSGNSVPDIDTIMCVNRPPCSKGETEITSSKGQKWCKKTGIVIGTQQFRDKASNILLQIETERELRFSKLSKREMAEAKKEADQDKDWLTAFEAKLNKLLDTPKDDIEERLARLDNPSPLSLEHFKQSTQEIQKQKRKIQTETSVITLVRETIEAVDTDIKENDKIRKETEQKVESNINIESTLAKALERMTVAQEQMTTALKSQQDRLIRLEAQQENINRAARKTLGEEYWNEELQQLLRGGIKATLSATIKAPFKILNQIVFRPAGYAFWYFFGKWFYLIWGLLMLMLILLSVWRIYTYAETNYPAWTGVLWEAAMYLWSAASQAGSLLAKSMGESFEDMLLVAKDQATSLSQAGWEQLQSILASLWSQIIDTITSSLVNSVKIW
jgi:hypothetical protein